MRRTDAAMVATILLIGGLVQGLASPAEAVSPTRFSGVQYDSPGDDTGSNRSLNAEWVRITNHSSHARVMTGWKLRDITGFLYVFPRFTLGAGKSVRVHTGSGVNSRTELLAAQRLCLEQHRRQGNPEEQCRRSRRHLLLGRRRGLHQLLSPPGS